MANSYSLMVGLTSVDETGPYYSRHFPGFDSRSGCEGCRKDVERMENLTHYVGFQRVLDRHLLDAEATKENVITALRSVAKATFLKEGDLFLFYLSSHGVAVGTGTRRDPVQAFGSVLDGFLLYDQAILNVEILAELVSILRRNIGVVTIIDACHAGLGTNLEGGWLRGGDASEKAAFASKLLGESYKAVRRIEGRQIVESSTPARLQGLFDNLLTTENTKSGFGTYGLFHLGASRDEGVAQGGSEGSALTSAIEFAYINGGHSMSYTQFAKAVLSLLKQRQSIQFGSLPMNAAVAQTKIFKCGISSAP